MIDDPVWNLVLTALGCTVVWAVCFVVKERRRKAQDEAAELKQLHEASERHIREMLEGVHTADDNWDDIAQEVTEAHPDWGDLGAEARNNIRYGLPPSEEEKELSRRLARESLSTPEQRKAPPKTAWERLMEDEGQISESKSGPPV